MVRTRSVSNDRRMHTFSSSLFHVIWLTVPVAAKHANYFVGHVCNLKWVLQLAAPSIRDKIPMSISSGFTRLASNANECNSPPWAHIAPRLPRLWYIVTLIACGSLGYYLLKFTNTFLLYRLYAVTRAAVVYTAAHTRIPYRGSGEIVFSIR